MSGNGNAGTGLRGGAFGASLLPRQPTPDTWGAVDNNDFVSQVDVAAVLGQFLNGLHDDDILTELFQNDLDQRATRTVVRFEPDRLVVEGDGLPVDQDGWTRLTYVAGAGGEVVAKPLGFGVKNHGLRACFMLGDEIHVRSGGKRILLTACKNGSGTYLAPGSWRESRPDTGPDAPMRGCRIEVPYRKVRLPSRGGDLPPLDPPTPERLQAVFNVCVSQLPRRFMGVIRPGSIPSWRVELHHWQLGRFTVQFDVLRRSPELLRNIFRRRCVAEGPSGTAVIDEEVWTFDEAPPDQGMRVPAFFRERTKIRCDVAWELDGRGRPKASHGQLRYPIGYSGRGADSATGIGVHFTAPFASDVSRHGLAVAEGQKSINDALLSFCQEELVVALRRYLLRRYGPTAFSLLSGQDASGVAKPEQVIRRAAQQGALLILDRQKRKARTSSKAPIWKLPPPGATVLLPAARGSTTWSKRLASLAPPEHPCIHPDTPDFVLSALLATSDAPRAVPAARFDEIDVLERVAPKTAGVRFPWRTDIERQQNARDLGRALDVLDLLRDARDEVRQRAKLMLDRLVLPDSAGVLRPWSSLRRASVPPPTVPGIALPALVHPDLARHPVLIHGLSAIKAFDLEEHLLTIDAQKWDHATRSAFAQWLLGHRGELSATTRSKLAAQPVWPAADGRMVRLDEFCRPKDPEVAKLLAADLTMPSRELARSGWMHATSRRRVSVRDVPTEAEFAKWFERRLGELPALGARAISADIVVVRQLERDLLGLIASSGSVAVAKLLPKLRLPDGHGDMRPVASLHVESNEVRRCFLLPEDLVTGPNQALYERAGCRTKPSREALVRALTRDGRRVEAVWDRLEAWRAALVGQEPANDLQNVPIFDVRGRLYPPARVFVPGREFGSWWGTWRVPLEADLSPIRKTSARRAGAVGAEPTPEWSREYFNFLSRAPDQVPENIRQIVRHLQHRDGPLSWWEQYPALPCVPFRDKEDRIELVARRDLLRLNSPYFVADFGDPVLEEQILERDSAVRFAVTSVRDLQVYLSEKLKERGIRSLREAMNEPTELQAVEPGPVADRYAGVLKGLQSPAQLERIRGAMDVAGVRMSLLRTRWQASIRRIREVRVAKGLTQEWQLRRYKYQTKPAAGVDRSGTLWLTEGNSDIDAAFFEALSKEMFGPTAPQMYGFALKAAVASAHQAFASRRASLGSQLGLPFFPDESEPQPGGGKDDGAAHGPIEVDPSLNLPSPEPLLSEDGRGDGSGGNRRRRRGGGGGRGGVRPAPVRPVHELEAEHIESLKRQHYAWHCQICLGGHEPAILAPRLSYVATAELRRGLMEAHHVQHYRVGGARHGANLLVLCELHHANTGDRLTRKLVVDGLTDAAEECTRTFEDGTGNASRVAGKLIRVRVDGQDAPLPIFFTNEHAKAWREFPEGQ